jgi:PilZ domain
MSAEGRAFTQNAHAHNISSHGARLSGIEHSLKTGDIIGVQLAEKKARFKVIWVIEAGHLRKVEAGVQLLEGQLCPWLQELQKPQAAPTPVSEDDTSSKNKRKFLRHKLPFPLEIRDQRSGPGAINMRTQATDISGRGCYVETLMPLPQGLNLNVTFWLDSERITVPAVVRTCDGGVGMGIEFTGLDSGTQDRLQKELDRLDEEANSSKTAHGAN